jgi:hypothetical protein
LAIVSQLTASRSGYNDAGKCRAWIDQFFGERLRKSGAGQVGPTLAAELSPEIRAAVVPRLAEVEALNQRIAA